jgi:outer membrane protein OmpA-like peptidoglycan-associated protein
MRSYSKARSGDAILSPKGSRIPATPAVQAYPVVDVAQTKQVDAAMRNNLALGIQAKLAVGQPNDQYEQEADHVAAQVMGMGAIGPSVQRNMVPEEEDESVQMKPISGITPLVQRDIAPEQGEEEEAIQTKVIQRDMQPEEEEAIQMKPEASGPQQASGSLEGQLQSSKSGGSPLSEEVRGFMEPRFGADFSGVRVHTGGEAVQMTQSLGAQAFAHGQDIYYNSGKAPANNELTAHELTHVIQQTGTLQRKPAAAPAADKVKNNELAAFLRHGLFGPKALVPPTKIGGFDASYNPKTSRLLIAVKSGVDFNNGLKIDGSGVITATHTDLNQAAIDGMSLPVKKRAKFVSQFIWNKTQKQKFNQQLEARIEKAWSGKHSFTCTKPGWEKIKAHVAVDVNVHEGAKGKNDHLQSSVYRVPDGGSYNVGAYVQSHGDLDPHNNEMVMSSKHVKPTPISQSLLRKSVEFDHDSATLTASAKATLRAFERDFQDAKLDLTNPVQLIGRASSKGTTAHNKQLAQSRIDTVRNFLASIGFTGINERISTRNMGEAGATEDPEWCRVDLVVGSGEGQLVATHEFGHVFGLADEYVSNNVNPGGSISGSGKAVGSVVGHDDMAKAIGTSGAIAENNDNIMSLGNAIKPEHYATFGWSLGQVTGVSEWKVG